jgi:hypothetical protein
MKIASFMVADHEPVILNFEALEAACKLSFNEEHRQRMTSVAESYRAWSKATRCPRNNDNGGLLCPDKKLKLHLKKIAKKAGELTALLNVDLATHPREYDAVEQVWYAMGLEEAPPNHTVLRGLSLPPALNPEDKFYSPRNLPVILEMYAQGAKGFKELMPQSELNLHINKIAKKAGELAALLNVDLATRPREYDAVEQVWYAMGLEEAPPNHTVLRGLSLPPALNPEDKFYSPRRLAVILEMYSRGAKELEELMPKSKGGRPDDWNLFHYVKVLRTIFREAGGGDRILCYKSEERGRCRGAFFDFVCEWCSKALGLPLYECENPVWWAIEKEQAEKKKKKLAEKELAEKEQASREQ